MSDNNLKSPLFQVSPGPNSELSEHHSLGSFATLPSSSEDSTMGNLQAMMVGYNSSAPTNNGKMKRKLFEDEAASYMLVSRNPNTNPNDLQGDMVTPTPPSKRPPGRPRGSKNKPKPKAPIPTMQAANGTTLFPIVLDIYPGNDVVESLIDLARHRNMGIYIHSGVGLLSCAAIREPTPSNTEIHVDGLVTMVSLNGSYFGGSYVPLALPQLHPFQSPIPARSPCSSFSVILAGPNARTFAGIVVGKMLAADIVRVVAIMVKKPEYISSPLVVDNNNEDNNHDLYLGL